MSWCWWISRGVNQVRLKRKACLLVAFILWRPTAIQCHAMWLGPNREREGSSTTAEASMSMSGGRPVSVSSICALSIFSILACRMRRSKNSSFQSAYKSLALSLNIDAACCPLRSVRSSRLAHARHSSSSWARVAAAGGGGGGEPWSGSSMPVTPVVEPSSLPSESLPAAWPSVCRGSSGSTAAGAGGGASWGCTTSIPSSPSLRVSAEGGGSSPTSGGAGSSPGAPLSLSRPSMRVGWSLDTPPPPPPPPMFERVASATLAAPPVKPPRVGSWKEEGERMVR